MQPRLGGRVVLVTGAGQGIGRGAALALARQGAQVGIAGRTLAKCEAVAAEIGELGGSAVAIACDVAQRADVQAAVETVVGRFGGLDGLVNNASTAPQRLLADVTDAEVEDVWRIAAMGTLYGMQAALPHLRARGGGAIVNVGSSTAIDGNATYGAYAMAKEAIRGVSRVAAREWGRYNIRVNVIVPNAATPPAEAFAAANPDRFARIQNAIALRRVGDPEADIGRAVASLMSDDMAYLTADTLMLTGG